MKINYSLSDYNDSVSKFSSYLDDYIDLISNRGIDLGLSSDSVADCLDVLESCKCQFHKLF